MTHDPAAHATIGEAGQCADCRALAVELLHDAPRRYLLAFPDNDAMALVPAFSFDTAVEAAWATGCNGGGQVGGQELPVEVVERAAVPLFTLLTGPSRVAARDALMAAARDTGYST